MNVTTIYRCKCGKESERKYDAALCCLPSLRSSFKVGDIVTMNYGRGWFDGDIRWVVNPGVVLNPGPLPSPLSRVPPPNHGNCFAKCCTMGFFYVITAIDRSIDPDDDLERPRIHLLTKAMTGKEGYRQFYNYEEYLTKVRNPKRFLLQDSKDVIGEKAEYFGS